MFALQTLFEHAPSPITAIEHSLLGEKGIKLWIKRDDQLVLKPFVENKGFCGNKWRKLQLNLKAAKEKKYQQLLTFGGAFSNHIAATASAGALFGFKPIGIIRGERIEPLNPTLSQAERCGMQLHFIDRSSYRTKQHPVFLKTLEEKFGRSYILPEGGTNLLAIEGCKAIIAELEQQFPILPDYVCVSGGTGGTIAGIIQGLEGRSSILGFSALKGTFLATEIQALFKQYELPTYSNWEIQTDYHFGGFAKFKPELIDFINTFKQNHQIQLEPLYTGKMLFGLLDLIEKDYFRRGSRIVAIHTGGLQGIEGFNQRFGNAIKVE